MQTPECGSTLNAANAAVDNVIVDSGIANNSTANDTPNSLSCKAAPMFVGDGFSSPFYFTIGSSRLALICHVMASALALLGVCLSSLVMPWLGFLLVGLLALAGLGYFSLRSQSDLHWQVVHGECYLRQEKVGNETNDVGISRQPVILQRGWQLSPWVLQLRYRRRGQRRWRSMLVWPDSATVETRRILRSHEAFGRE